MAEIAQQRGEELIELLETRGLGDAGGVEDQPAELVGPPTAEVVADDVVVLGQCGPHRFDDAALPADQQGPGQRLLAGPVAAQRLGLRDPELFGQERTGAGVDDLGQEIGSHSAAFRVSRGARSFVPRWTRPGVGYPTVVSITNLLQSKNGG